MLRDDLKINVRLFRKHRIVILGHTDDRCPLGLAARDIVEDLRRISALGKQNHYVAPLDYAHASMDRIARRAEGGRHFHYAQCMRNALRKRSGSSATGRDHLAT